jgi:TRAP-type C4-dicarboxylate transport system permease small subunit
MLKWLDAPIHLLLWIGLLAGFLMMAHTAVDVAGRTIFNHPFAGTTEIVAGWYMVAAAYLPWAFIARQDSHIVVDLFTRALPPTFRYVLDVGVKILTILWVGLFTWQTWIQAIYQTRLGEVWQAATKFILIWPSRWMLPISGGLMLIYLVLRVISDVAHGPPRVRQEA